MHVRRRNPGDPLAVKASEWNAIAGVVNAATMPSRLLDRPIDLRLPAGVVYLRNDSGADAARFQPLRIAGSLAADDADAFLAQAAFAGVAADETDLPPGRWALALESIPDGEIGRAALLGVFPIRASVTDADHRFLRVVDGQPLLQSCSSGQVPIVWQPAGTGTLELVAALAPAAEPLEIWAKLISATPIDGQQWRWSYAWQEVTLAGQTATSADATRASETDGLAYNAMEHFNDDETLGSGVDPATLPQGYEPVPLGVGVIRLRREEGGAAWHFSEANHDDGECQDPVELLAIDGGEPGTTEFETLDAGEPGSTDPTPIDGGQPGTAYPEPIGGS